MTTKCAAPAIVLIALALAIVPLRPAAAETVFIPPVGGQGDRDGPPMMCPDSHPLLTGVFGRVGTWVDQLGILCSSLRLGWVTGDVIKHEYRGGFGGGDKPLVSCNANAGIRSVEIQIAYNNGKAQYVTAVTFNCHKPSTGEFTNTGAFGAAWFRDPFDARKNFTQNCPGNSYAVGFDARWGRHVNAIGLICDQLKEPGARPPMEQDGGFAPPPRPPLEQDGGFAQHMPETIGPGMENDTNRPFADYDSFDLPGRTPQSCQNACRANPAKCRAWAYTRPGTRGPKARCYLKDAVPAPVADKCCITGVEAAAPTPQLPPQGVTFEPGTDRFGSDYNRFDVNDPRVCQQICVADTKCRAWTWVRPGIHGPGGFCYVKSSVPPPKQDGCCVSGTVR